MSDENLSFVRPSSNPIVYTVFGVLGVLMLFFGICTAVVLANIDVPARQETIFTDPVKMNLCRGYLDWSVQTKSDLKELAVLCPTAP